MATPSGSSPHFRVSKKYTGQDVEDLLIEWFMEAVSAIVELEIRKKMNGRKKRPQQKEE